MAASRDLRWVHGPIAEVARGDGETHCPKVRSDKVQDGPSCGAKQRSGMRFHPSPEQSRPSTYPPRIVWSSRSSEQHRHSLRPPPPYVSGIGLILAANHVSKTEGERSAGKWVTPPWLPSTIEHPSQCRTTRHGPRIRMDGLESETAVLDGGSFKRHRCKSHLIGRNSR